jgi:hypothetical protein
MKERKATETLRWQGRVPSCWIELLQFALLDKYRSENMSCMPMRVCQDSTGPCTASYEIYCKICGFHGRDYKECRLLGYKNPVRTSHEAHYLSATEPSWLKLCKIWCFHDGDYEECHLLEFDAMWLLWKPTFRGNVLPPSSGWKESAS